MSNKAIRDDRPSLATAQCDVMFSSQRMFDVVAYFDGIFCPISQCEESSNKFLSPDPWIILLVYKNQIDRGNSF